MWQPDGLLSSAGIVLLDMILEWSSCHVVWAACDLTLPSGIDLR